MSDEPERTDRPQYGEYATPEEQRARIRQPDATLSIDEGYRPGTAPPAPAPEPTMGEVRVARRNHVDRVATIALLLVGAFNVVVSAASYFDFPASTARTWEMLGIPGEFTNIDAGRTWGMIAAIVLIVGYALTALLATLNLRAGRVSWWIPLVGAVVSYVVVSVCLAVPLLGDPSFVEYATTLGGS